MIAKTRAIVLHQIKYSDTGIVAQMYTRQSGRQSFLIRGMRNRKCGKHNVLFQPMFILDLVTYQKESRSMQMLKEFSVSYAPSGIYSDSFKNCISIFLAEVLSSVLREESANEPLFDYIEDSIHYFDKSTSGTPNFHIAFLSSLSGFLGFEPGRRTDDSEQYFDMLDGRFVTLPPVHGNYAPPGISGVLARFFSASFESAGDIPLTGSVRNEVLETILRYYSLHLPGLRKINSIGVMKEIFR
jgi:DNA repair protein RecO (recombination protein O)